MGASRRDVLRAGLALGWAALARRSTAAADAHVVVVGAGFGGATAAKYIRKWSGGAVRVTLIEREPAFVSCPLSNLVLAGIRDIASLTRSYDALERWGIRRIVANAEAIDPAARTLSVGSETLSYDRLILSPGMDFDWDAIPALKDVAAREKVPHAWKAGPQTIALRRQLEAMPDGGVFAMHIPLAPYRCPPAPYERACLVARYFLLAKKRSKVIVLDANEDVQAEKALFLAAWNGPYKGYVEYRPNSALVDVDVAMLTAKLDFEDVKADVLNVIPPQRAGDIARGSGMANANGRFCQVDFLTYESTAQRGIHILGDAAQPASLMPRSGHVANAQAKICAAAVVALLAGREANQAPVITSTCYTYLSDNEVSHIASVHRYDPAAKTMRVVPGSSGASSAGNTEEARFAEAWAENLWADTLG